MEKKQLAWYLIFGGLAIFLLKFIKTILTFMTGNPFLGLAMIIISIGLVILAFEE